MALEPRRLVRVEVLVDRPLRPRRPLRQPDGTIRVVRRGANVKVVKTNPLQAHIDLLDRITDKQIHDLVAYLARMK